MPTSSPLPPNWSEVLDSIQQALAQAIQLAETRESALAGQACPSPTAPPADPLATWLEGLAQHVASAQQPLHDLDRALTSEEDFVREHLAKIGDLRERLTQWTLA